MCFAKGQMSIIWQMLEFGLDWTGLESFPSSGLVYWIKSDFDVRRVCCQQGLIHQYICNGD
jgi:hypothetical protein